MIDHVKEVEKIFMRTQDEPFMSGDLIYCRFLDGDVLMIKSRYRMDANMMVMLREGLGGRIVGGNCKGDLLYIKV